MAAALDWWSQQGVTGFQPQGSDINQAGAGSDPFAYTMGSLLTPWSGKFQAPAGSGGTYQPPQLAKFEFGQASVPRFERMGPAPEFSYGDFTAPDSETFKQDPGYQFRLKESQRALENSAAARGALMGANTWRQLQDNAQGLASQEYGNAFNRALGTYQTNRGNAAENFDRNFGAKLNTFNANTGAAQAEGTLGLSAWDRNMGLARTQWQDAKDAAEAQAAAGAAGSAQSYGRALGEYEMARDEFWRNQDRQYSMLMGQAGLGLGAAGQAGAYGSAYAGNLGSIYGQQADAKAAGTMGGANAWQSVLGGVGNAAMQYGMYRATEPRMGQQGGGYGWMYGGF